MDIKAFLDIQFAHYNQVAFIENDPLSIPHAYTKKQDIEISAFWTAMLAWGQRKTIISKAKDLFSRMGSSPHEFIVNHREVDRKKFEDFKHRTFNYTDTLYFLDRLQRHYQQNDSLESAFLQGESTPGIRQSLSLFHERFFDADYAPERSRKHISTPIRKSSCKRLNMFLRWMVRKDAIGVDFGLWEKITPDQLMMPLDVHVGRVARKLGLLERKQNDWLAVEELTGKMLQFDAKDPVKYDFALFGMGVEPD
jgi:uncharacterized protein (TIGR02757 family)